MGKLYVTQAIRPVLTTMSTAVSLITFHSVTVTEEHKLLVKVSVYVDYLNRYNCKISRVYFNPNTLFVQIVISNGNLAAYSYLYDSQKIGFKNT